MTPDDLVEMQRKLGLSDGKMAQSIGVTRQTWRNWRRGCKCPLFAQNALRWMMELRRLDAANDNLPQKIKALVVMAAAAVSGHRSWQSLQRYTHIRKKGDKYAGWRWRPGE